MPHVAEPWTWPMAVRHKLETLSIEALPSLMRSTGKIHLTKKKSMKLKKNKQQAGNDLWKQGSAMSFHNKRKKKASA